MKQEREELVAQGARFNIHDNLASLQNGTLKNSGASSQLPLVSEQQPFLRKLTGQGSPSKEHESFGLDK